MLSPIRGFLRSRVYTHKILPAALLSGTIIGAGVFSLPFIFERAGWVAGAFYLVAGTAVFYYIHVMYADIILRSGESFKFVGYARQYLGEAAFWISILVTVIGALLTLTAYLVLANKFFEIIFPGVPMINGSLSLFWLISSITIFISVKRMARLEFLITGGMIAIIFLIFLFGLFGNPERITEMATINWGWWWLPFGPVLFSISGRSAVPAVIEYFEENRIPFDQFKKVIFWGTTVPAIVYGIFVVGVIGIASIITENSIAVFKSLPSVFPAAVGVLGLLSLWSSYIVIGMSVDEILRIDLKIPKIMARLAVVVVPVLFIYAGFNDFIKLIALAGGIFLALEGIIVTAMWQKVEVLGLPRFLFILRPVPRIIPYLLLGVFLVGVIYSAGF